MTGPSTKGAGTTLLSAQDIHINFGGVAAADGVSLDVLTGERLAIIGPNGAGKTTFINISTGYLRPQSGKVTLDGVDITRRAPRAISRLGVARSFQIPQLFTESTAIETLLLAAAARSRAWNPFQALLDRPERAEMLHILELLGVPDVAERVIGELPEGTRKLIDIGVALALKPRLLLMDEPTAALDLLMQRSIISMLRELRDEFDLTIVFITHDLPLVAGLSDRIGVMYAFEFIEVGDTRSLLKDAAHPYTRALLRSVPSIDSDLDSMQPIEGARPDPVNIPNGCSFHPRCPIADDRCEIEDPGLVSVDDDHTAACFYTDQARSELEYRLDHGVVED